MNLGRRSCALPSGSADVVSPNSCRSQTSGRKTFPRVPGTAPSAEVSRGVCDTEPTWRRRSPCGPCCCSDVPRLDPRPLPSPHSAGRRTVVSYPGPLRLRQLLARPSFRVTRPCRLRAERVGCRGGGPVLEWSDVTAHAQGLCAQSGEVPAVQRPVSHHALVCAGSTSRGPGRGPRGRPRGLAVPVWLVPAPCAVRKGVTAQPAPDRAVVAASRAQGPGRGRSRPGASELLTPDSVPPASSERPGTSGHSYWTNRGRPPPAFSGLLFTFSGFAALPSFSSCFHDQVFTHVFPTLKANEPLLKGWK